jgi:NAD(P)-dependent dehydrogenase (short-subunit alcohol dehydrogenase family)
MTSAILVTGGTGTLGRLVVARLRDAGCNVRVLLCVKWENELRGTPSLRSSQNASSRP